MSDPYSIGQILWSSDPATRSAIWSVLSVVIVACIAVYLPLIIRVVRIYLLERKLRSLAIDAGQKTAQSVLNEFERLFTESVIGETYVEFERRWESAELREQSGRAPIRLIDLFDEKPLLPLGPRRSLLPVLPGLFLATGVFAALYGLIPSLAETNSVNFDANARSAWLAAQMGLGLRACAWGFLSAMVASLATRLIEGAYDARSHSLDEVVESAFGSVSPGELAEITRQTQQSSLETLGRELTGFADELNQRLEQGLQRIEQSTARSANLVSQEQRGALHSIVGELSLSVRQGVEHHLTELRGALQRAVEHQNSVTGGLAETFQSMVENSKIQDRVARTLSDAAHSVEEASHAMRGSSNEMGPLLQHLEGTSTALSKTADRIGDTQLVVARTAEGVRSSLETAATGVKDQREFIEVSLGEIRRAMSGLGDGLGESLQRSLHDVDDALSKSVAQLRETLAESNETIDRLSSPIRATEGSTREIHLALDRVRNEVEVVGQWLNQASKPLRSGLADVEGRAEEIGRAMVEFNNHARQIDKTMEALRHEIHEESRRIQGAGSDLGRRLQQTSDAVTLLETTTSEAARRAQVEPSGALSRSSRGRKDQKWSGTSSKDAPAGERNPSPGSHGIDPDELDATGRDDRRDSSFEMRPFAGGIPASEIDRSGADEKSSSASTTVGLTGAGDAASGDPNSSFRVGVPRAAGPDPYRRFDEGNGEDAPSNLRHFPTPERELGEDLKLSGLLGPRIDKTKTKDAAGASNSSSTPPARSPSTAKPKGKSDRTKDGN